MGKAKPLSGKFLDSIRAVVGPRGWIEDAAAMEPYLAEARGLFRGACAMVARPASTDEVARVVALCARARVAVVPQGGNTGLCGGAVPESGILLSLARLDRIRAVDAVDHTLVAEAGCVLADVQKAADEAGCLFPLSLAAEGSCRIGGNVATNAGGVHVLRYGTMRDLVLGLEVVLPDGRIWDGLRALRKDNTGYDLKQLFIGAEGTLGIVTAAALKLFPKPRARAVAMAAMADAENTLALFARLRDACGESLNAFEFMNRFSLDCALKHIPDTRDPFAAKHAFYALMELASPREGDQGLQGALESVLHRAAEDGIVADATIAASEAQASALWRLRESIPEAQKGEGGSIKHDVAVAVSRVPEFLRRADRLVLKALPGVRVCAFGHLGDGNVHYNLSQPLGMDRARFMAEWDRFSVMVHDLAAGMGGSFSAEHGIGRLKLGELERYKEDVEIDLMRALKRALDPKNIMNPGKVVKV